MGACGQHHRHFSLASEIPVIWKKPKKEKENPTSLHFLKIIFFFLNQPPFTSSQLVNPSQHVQSIKERQCWALLHPFNKNEKPL